MKAEEHINDNNGTDDEYEEAEDEVKAEAQNSDDEGRAPCDSARKGRKRVKVMNESGQTDVERRQIRRLQRDLQKRIVERGSDLGSKMEDSTTDAFEKIRGENNAIFERVLYTRESVLDADNLDLISRRAARQGDRLVQVPRYDASRLVDNLRSKCCLRTNDRPFDWLTFGIECGTCFNTVPSTGVSFLAGPIHVEFEPKARKKPERRKKVVEDDVEEEEVEDVVQKKGSSKADGKGEGLSAVEKQMTVMQKVLKKRCGDVMRKQAVGMGFDLGSGRGMENLPKEEKQVLKKIGASQVCLAKFLLNPDSFTQTVENIFSLSFMVKKGAAEVGVRSEEDCARIKESKDSFISEDGNYQKELEINPGPYVTTRRENEREIKEFRQTIVTFTKKNWKDMLGAFSVDKCDMPQRAGGRAS